MIRLLPLIQAELRGSQSWSLEHVFASEVPGSTLPIVGDDLDKTVLAGGYPEALARSGW